LICWNTSSAEVVFAREISVLDSTPVYIRISRSAVPVKNRGAEIDADEDGETDEEYAGVGLFEE
jgi:hypothetical protein